MKSVRPKDVGPQSGPAIDGSETACPFGLGREPSGSDLGPGLSPVLPVAGLSMEVHDR